MSIVQASFLDDQTPQKISQDEINGILWRACDPFRGTVDPSEYKNYILVVLFLKYISDVWQDHYALYREQFSEDDERIRRLTRERFVLLEGCDFNGLYQQRKAENIGEQINERPGGHSLPPSSLPDRLSCAPSPKEKAAGV
ncbi:MAG TPA: type I restriction-modification system subunit M N-terminal domain-containing protein [Ktedonobacteraceae bacterium]|nr:type I restriction-modification system subunit M N-terminal domain-containing protein [Ktedonobacteraceae bacterium]